MVGLLCCQLVAEGKPNIPIAQEVRKELLVIKNAAYATPEMAMGNGAIRIGRRL